MRAAIFDLDGVIVDTSIHHYEAWKALADELGIPFSPEDNERLKGVSRMDSLDIILSLAPGVLQLGPGEKAELARKKNSIYVAAIGSLTPDDMLPGVRKFIEECRQREIPTAIASASRNAPAVIYSLQARDLFTAIVDGNSVSKAKPDPEVFLEAARLLSVPAENCVVFEDAAAGVQGALAAGMTCIGIGDPHILAAAQRVIPGFDGISTKDIF